MMVRQTRIVSKGEGGDGIRTRVVTMVQEIDAPVFAFLHALNVTAVASMAKQCLYEQRPANLSQISRSCYTSALSQTHVDMRLGSVDRFTRFSHSCLRFSRAATTRAAYQKQQQDLYVSLFLSCIPCTGVSKKKHIQFLAYRNGDLSKCLHQPVSFPPLTVMS